MHDGSNNVIQVNSKEYLAKRELKKLIDDAHRSEKPIIAIVMG